MKGRNSIYSRIHDLSARRSMESRRFDGEAWREWLDIYKADQNREAQRDMRKLIQYQTISYFQKLKYSLPDGTVVKICDQAAIVDQASRTEHHNFEHVYEFETEKEKPFKQDHVISVIPRDCLEVALYLKQEMNLNPLVLNMASPKRPGGGFRNGSAAQEENIFRRSNYFQVLEDLDRFDKNRKWKYPLAIYSPSVWVIRESEMRGYALLPEPVSLSFVAIAAYRRPPCHIVKGVHRLTQSMMDGTRRKIRVILHVAREHGHDSLVLSAFGCGAFKNPACHMAELFKEVLEEKEWQGYFKHISFAIIEDNNSFSEMTPLGNYPSFKRVFSDAPNSFSTEPVCKIQEKPVDKQKNQADITVTTDTEKKVKEIPIKTAERIAFNDPQDPYGCFSSSFKARVIIDNVGFPSTEHYLQYHKFSEQPENSAKLLKVLQVEKMLDATKAWKPRADWEEDMLLREATEAKFKQHPDLFYVLKSTGEVQLIYHNLDPHFGDGGDGTGENVLGKLLVEIREDKQ